MFNSMIFWFGYVFGFIPYTMIGTTVGALYYRKYKDRWDKPVFLVIGLLWPFALLVHLCYNIFKLVNRREYVRT